MFSQRQVAEFKEASYFPVLKILKHVLHLTYKVPWETQLEIIRYPWKKINK
jgi:hypothetical protein